MKKNVIRFMATLVFVSSVAVSCGNKKTSTTESKQTTVAEPSNSGDKFIPVTDSVQTTVTERNVSPLNIGKKFTPTGYMGCWKSFDVNPAFPDNPHSGSSCYRIAAFQRKCSEGWTGLYWTNRNGEKGANWGEYPGTDLSSRGYTKITFWAKGNSGGEKVEFGSGGINNTFQGDSFHYKDSYGKTYIGGRTVILTKKWQQYTIDLAGKDLSSVIGGFFWVASKDANPTGLIFYLDDILFE